MVTLYNNMSFVNMNVFTKNTFITHFNNVNVSTQCINDYKYKHK